jgi:hypothetical protein
MRTLAALPTRFPGLFRVVTSTVVIGALGGLATYAQAAVGEDSCCYPGSPCCYPGSPCCAHGHHTK